MILKQLYTNFNDIFELKRYGFGDNNQSVMYILGDLDPYPDSDSDPDIFVTLFKISKYIYC